MESSPVYKGFELCEAVAEAFYVLVGFARDSVNRIQKPYEVHREALNRSREKPEIEILVHFKYY